MITIDTLEKELSKGILRNLYLLYGEEEFLLEMTLKKIKKVFGEYEKGINYIVIDETNINQLIPNIETPAFGYDKKLIIVKNTGIFKKVLKGKGENLSADKEKINEYINENIELINQSCVLVFVEHDADKIKLYNTLEKLGVVCNFVKQKPIQIEGIIRKICNLKRVNIGEDVLKYFIECCGTDLQNLVNEIKKLIEYVGENGTITKEDVDRLAIKKVESIIFDLTDNLGKRDIVQALKVLNELIFSKEPTQKILITLYNHFKKIYITKVSIDNNKDIAKSLELKPNQTFLINKYKIQAKYFKKEEIEEILTNLIDLDYKYKIGLIDVNIGLEAIICSLK